MKNTRLFETKENDQIHVYVDDELSYWALKWGVSKEAIKSAIKASKSTSVNTVYTYLVNKNKPDLMRAV